MNLFEKLMDIIDVLENEGVEYVVIGGFAMVLHGLPRATQDIDLLVSPTETNVERLKVGLKKLYEDDSIQEITVDTLEKYPVIRYGAPDGSCIDIIAKIGDAFSFEDVRYDVIDVEGHKIKVATVESLYRLKSGTIRPIDRSDSVFLDALMKRHKEGE
jgi:hypothetical protein